MALQRKGPFSVLLSRPVLIFVPVLALLAFAFQQATRETERFQDCVTAGVTPQRAYLCMDSVAASEAMLLDAYGYPYWLMPDAPNRQVEEAVGAICRVYSRAREGIRRNDCTCALDRLHVELPEAEFAILAQAIDTQVEGEVVVAIPADLLSRLEALIADPTANAPDDVDGTPVSLPAGFAFTTSVADQWRRLVGEVMALDDEAPARLVGSLEQALDGCSAPLRQAVAPNRP